MAGEKRQTAKKDSIDPIYKKYTRSVIRTLADTEFYEFFMDQIAHAKNNFQFSNRRVVKSVDERWVDAIEEALPGLQNIIQNPRNVIQEEEIIVNIANAKKTNSDVVRHLAKHGALMDDFDEDSGDARPNKLMQKLREDSVTIYENRLVFTVLESAMHFVKIRYDALFRVLGDEFGAKLKMESDMENANEILHCDMFVHIKEKDSILDIDSKNEDIFSRIARLYRVLSMFMETQFAKELMKVNRVKGAIVKTNVLKRNPDYKKIVKLYDFLRHYNDIGYSLRVVEQAPDIDERLERDIYHNVMFNYIILKGYLEEEDERMLPTASREKKRTIKPKFIREIIEELTEDYDMPDVEVRKVLIEELTKSELMKEESAERHRLVEEQAKRKKEEAERAKAQREAERAAEREKQRAEKELIRQQKEAEKQRILAEKMEQENKDRLRMKLFRKEIEAFYEELGKRITLREEAEKKASKIAEREDYADAAKEVEDRENRQRDEKERAKKREALKREKELREAQLAEKARLNEELRIKNEQLKQQIEKDMEQLKPYITQVKSFEGELSARIAERRNYLESEAKRIEDEKKQRQIRRSGGFSDRGNAQ